MPVTAVVLSSLWLAAGLWDMVSHVATPDVPETPQLLPWQEGEALASLHGQCREPAREVGKEQGTDLCSFGGEIFSALP